MNNANIEYHEYNKRKTYKQYSTRQIRLLGNLHGHLILIHSHEAVQAPVRVGVRHWMTQNQDTKGALGINQRQKMANTDMTWWGRKGLKGMEQSREATKSPPRISPAPLY